MRFASDAAGLLKASFDRLNGVTLDVNDADVAFHASLLSLTDSLKTNGTTLNLNTKEGVANNQAISDAIKKAQSHAEAVSHGTTLTAAGTKAYLADLMTLRERIRMVGGNTTAIDAMIRKMAQTPKVVPTRFETDTATANARVAGFQAALRRTPTRWGLTIQAATSGAYGSVNDLLQYIERQQPVVIVRTVTLPGAPVHGGGLSAGGTNYWRGGLTKINETGGVGETIDLPRGSRIYPRGQKPPPVGGGGTTVVMNFNGVSPLATKQELARVVVDALAAYQKNGNRLP
jgi:hypothetical protein